MEGSVLDDLRFLRTAGCACVLGRRRFAETLLLVLPELIDELVTILAGEMDRVSVGANAPPGFALFPSLDDDADGRYQWHDVVFCIVLQYKRQARITITRHAKLQAIDGPSDRKKNQGTGESPSSREAGGLSCGSVFLDNQARSPLRRVPATRRNEAGITSHRRAAENASAGIRIAFGAQVPHP